MMKFQIEVSFGDGYETTFADELLSEVTSRIIAQYHDQITARVNQLLFLREGEFSDSRLEAVAQDAIRAWATSVGPGGKSPQQYIQERLNKRMEEVIATTGYTRMAKLADLMGIELAPDIAEATLDILREDMKAVLTQKLAAAAGKALVKKEV